MSFTGCTPNQSKKEIASLIFICEVSESFVLLGVSIWQVVREGKCSYDRVKYLIGVQGSSVLEVWWLICLVRRTPLCLIHTSSVSGSPTLLTHLWTLLFLQLPLFFSLPFTFVFSLPFSSIISLGILSVPDPFFDQSFSLFETIIELSSVCSIYTLADNGNRICDICSYLQTRSVGCGTVWKKTKP